jgi:hypothetical protein
MSPQGSIGPLPARHRRADSVPCHDGLMLVLGHRGASADAPENTPEAFALADEMGADGVELDVRRVVPTAGCSWPTIRCPTTSPRWTLGLATLDEALDACGDRMLVNVEIKNWKRRRLRPHDGDGRPIDRGTPSPRASLRPLADLVVLVEHVAACRDARAGDRNGMSHLDPVAERRLDRLAVPATQRCIRGSRTSTRSGGVELPRAGDRGQHLDVQRRRPARRVGRPRRRRGVHRRPRRGDGGARANGANGAPTWLNATP